MHGGVNPSLLVGRFTTRPDARKSKSTPEPNSKRLLDLEESDMNNRRVNRREFLGSAAVGAATFALAPSLLAAPVSAMELNNCKVNHTELSRNLASLLGDPSVNDSEKNKARKTCACIHCGVGITVADFPV